MQFQLGIGKSLSNNYHTNNLLMQQGDLLTCFFVLFHVGKHISYVIFNRKKIFYFTNCLLFFLLGNVVKTPRVPIKICIKLQPFWYIYIQFSAFWVCFEWIK